MMVRTVVGMMVVSSLVLRLDTFRVLEVISSITSYTR